ncbi:MAG: hypothetical protein QG583_897 [Patescibacteria group bacterium]|nr:hypothetical protein [Patescibacteria group bacterium]
MKNNLGVNPVRSNAHIHIEHPVAGHLFRNINLRELGIPNMTGITNLLKIEYIQEIQEADSTINHGHCDICDKYHPNFVARKKVKILKIWEHNGYFEIQFKNHDERVLLLAVMKAVREELQHDKHVCEACLTKTENEDEF